MSSLPKSYTYLESYELILLAILIWREARNQPIEGKRAVAWSVRNRVLKPGKTWYGDDWEEVVLKPWQYTSFEKSDPNSSKLPADPSKDAAWADSLLVADEVYRGLGTDPTAGATHYYNPKAVAKPTWVDAPGSTYKCTIGDHWFYVAT